MNKETMKRDEMKQRFRRIGYALFWLIVTMQITQGILIGLINRFAPEITESSWYLGIILGIGFYGTAFPLFLWLMKKIPNGPKGSEKKLAGQQILQLFFISTGLIYLFVGLNLLLDSFIPLSGPFQVTEMITSLDVLLKSLPALLFIDIFSPIIEEIVFRGVLLDKLRGYGDKRAILFSAVAFALFHGNLTQFIYTLPMGIVYGYVALRTNTIRYTIILHILHNSFSTFLLTLGLVPNIDAASLYTGIIVALTVIGLILLLKNFKKVELSTADRDEKISQKVVYGNRGVLLFYTVSIILIAFSVAVQILS